MTGRGKITTEIALAIRETYSNPDAGGAGYSTLAARFGVSTATIHKILAGEHPKTAGLPRISGTRGNLFLRRPVGQARIERDYRNQ